MSEFDQAHIQYVIDRAVRGADEAKGISPATETADTAREARRVANSIRNLPKKAPFILPQRILNQQG